MTVSPVAVIEENESQPVGYDPEKHKPLLQIPQSDQPSSRRHDS